VLRRLLATADAAGRIGWAISVDSTIARAHQHATTITRHPGAGSNHSSRAIRAYLRRRRITAVIPEPADQAGPRARHGSRGGRPPAFDAAVHRNRDVIERRFNHATHWRGITTRYDTLAVVYRAAVVPHAVIT
jgi:transposase